MYKFKSRYKLMFIALIFCGQHVVYAAELVTVPLQPINNKIIYLKAGVIPRAEPKVTVMAVDPVITDHSAKGLKSKMRVKPSKNSIVNVIPPQNAKNTAVKKNTQEKLNTQTVKLPVDNSTQKVTNSGVTFIFSDITDRKGNGTKNLLTLPIAQRQLQVEAARLAAYKKKIK